MRYFILIMLLAMSCKTAEKKLTAQEIIDKTILHSGADLVANSEIKFEFRDINYVAVRKSGNFYLTRSFDSITDILSNNGFERLVNNVPHNTIKEEAAKFKNSVNSVHYFSVLPFGLNDSAVQKKLLASSIINNKEYYKIEISFNEVGGGEDFEDVFIYWIGKDDFLIDFLAYSFHTNGGGKRFRVLKEQCYKNGIRFVDYHNYKPLKDEIKLTDLDKAYHKNQLIKVSEIILKNIEVKL